MQLTKVVVWDLDLDCGTTVRRRYEGGQWYPAVNIFDCPCSSALSCEVRFRRLVEEKGFSSAA